MSEPIPKIVKITARIKNKMIVEKTVGYGCQVCKNIFFHTN